jgi:uncharacterized membrane protein
VSSIITTLHTNFFRITRLAKLGLLCLALAIVATGVFFRFYGLDRKIYTNDEATSSLRASGYTLADYGRLLDGRTRSVDEIAAYQRPGPGTTAAGTVVSLAIEDPQHAPIYYLILRAWTATAGNSVPLRRMPSALFGTLAILAAGWLGVELAGPVVGLIFALLVAVSPFQVIYSQQAREYSLWVAALAFSSALLLRALRGNDARTWVLYALSVAFALYTDVLFALSIAGYALFVALTQPLRWSGPLRAFCLATAIPIIAFAPWMYALYRGATLVTNNYYLGSSIGFKLFWLKWIFNTGAVFFDMEYGHAALALFLVPVFGIVIWSIVSLVRGGAKPPALFVLSMILVPAAALLLPDLVHHESRSTAARYLVPLWLGLELCVSLFLARVLLQTKPAVRVAGSAALAFLLICGIACDARNLPDDVTWADASAKPIGPIARLINARAHPLVIFVSDPQQWDFSVASLTTLLRPDIRFRLLAGPAIAPGALADLRADASGGEDELFLLDPTPRVQATVAQAIPGAWKPVEIVVEADDAMLRAARAQASASRAAVGFVAPSSSLWTPERDRYVDGTRN